MTNEKQKLTRAERVLASMAVGITILASLSFFIWIIGIWSGLTRESLATGIWPILPLLAWFGLPIAFALIFALIIMLAIRSSKQNKAGL